MKQDEWLLILERSTYITAVSYLDEFIGQVHTVQKKVITFIADLIETKLIVTVKYALRYSNGKDFTINIRDAIYFQDRPVRILRPQQMISQTVNESESF